MERIVTICITAFLIAAMASGTSCSINKQNKLADMVKQGNDPQKAACAVYYNNQ